jgi:hypothetical protein
LAWSARFLLLLFFALLLLGVFFRIYPFLAPNHPPHDGIMVVEGWIPDESLEVVAKMYRAGKYQKIICTGVPLEVGSYLLPFHSFSEMTAARFYHLGFSSNEVVAVSAPLAPRDRTYLSALALRDYLQTHPEEAVLNLHLLTIGPHGRRSWILFQKALEKERKIGITSLPDPAYDPARWYTCSRGVRAVIDESIACLYATFFFHP